jgi:hypothetical protein
MKKVLTMTDFFIHLCVNNLLLQFIKQIPLQSLVGLHVQYLKEITGSRLCTLFFCVRDLGIEHMKTPSG